MTTALAIFCTMLVALGGTFMTIAPAMGFFLTGVGAVGLGTLFAAARAKS